MLDIARGLLGVFFPDIAPRCDEAHTILSLDSPEAATLAAIAHELWRRCMIEQGWKHAGRFDENRCLHDALVPFSQLGRRDQEEAIHAMLDAEIPAQLARLIRYDRGPERAFTIDELKSGLQVGWAQHVVIDDPNLCKDDQGEIVDWDADPDTGTLQKFRVRWSSGSVTEHEPMVRDIRRVES